MCVDILKQRSSAQEAINSSNHVTQPAVLHAIQVLLYDSERHQDQKVSAAVCRLHEEVKAENVRVRWAFSLWFQLFGVREN